MKGYVILFILTFGSSFAQTYELKGRIFNLSDNSPVNLVNISIEGKNIRTVSEEDGSFRIKDDITPEEFVVFSHIGFNTRRIKIGELPNSGPLMITLEPKIITSQTILVRGSIGNEGTTPLTFSKIENNEIKSTYTTQDIPEMLNSLPSTSFYSENGNGIGYNHLSLRGFDQTRISISINGIPQNDPQDHDVYWIDFPDLLESTELIQVQRGAGSGIVGYPAVGGAINIITSTLSDKPRMEFSSSLGGYNTRKYSAEFSSGLISNKYSIYAKLSETLSGGYRNSSWVDLKSYYISAVRYDDNLTTQINLYGGPIADGLAFTGLPKFAVKDKDLRRANYSYFEATDKEYTYTITRRPDEIENFSQPHFELLNELKLSDKVSFNSALFLLLGNGYFDTDGSWADTNSLRISKQFGFNPTQNPGNVLIRDMVENRQWGWIPRLSIIHDDGELILGGELRIHRSVNWGSIEYGDGLPYGLSQDYRFYYFEGGKNIVNLYAHDDYRLNDRTSLLAELQLASDRYVLFNEKYLGNDFHVDNLFLNPRIGLNYKFSPATSGYFSFARVSREPTLVNYYDAASSSSGTTPQFGLSPNGAYDFSNPLVKPETMNDFEIGTTFKNESFNLSLDAYYMLFNNEIVQQGQVDRFGQPITGNMERTIHYGIEYSIDYKTPRYLEFVLNGSFSKNYISRGHNFATLSDGITSETVDIDLRDNSISGFPNMTLCGIIKFKWEDLYAQLSCKYVGEMFTDNFGSRLAELNASYPGLTDYTDNRVDPYFVMNFFISYTLDFSPVAKQLKIFFQADNLLDNLYASYGIGNEFFPAAERNILCGIKIGL